MKATVGSGSTETVSNKDEATNVEVTESAKSKQGVEYEVANSATGKNLGEKICEVMAPGLAGPKAMTLQVAKVHKTLLSRSCVSPGQDGVPCSLSPGGTTS